MTEAEKLQRLHDHGINFTIACFYGDGFDWMLGDHVHGFIGDGRAPTLVAAVDQVWKLARERHPFNPAFQGVA